MASQDTQFKAFKNNPVKVRYKDGEGIISTARGTLVDENEQFIFLKGDYNKICILKTNIEKITSSQVQRRQENDSSN